jgi:hypothetical protein
MSPFVKIISAWMDGDVDGREGAKAGVDGNGL